MRVSIFTCVLFATFFCSVYSQDTANNTATDSLRNAVIEKLKHERIMGNSHDRNDDKLGLYPKHLIGKVKSIDEYRYEASEYNDSTPFNKTKEHITYEFDTYGQLNIKHVKDRNHDVMNSHYYTYDDWGLVVQDNYISYMGYELNDDNGVITYVYNEEANCIKTIVELDDGGQTDIPILTYTHDDFGNVLKEYADYELLRYYKYTYDTQFRVVTKNIHEDADMFDVAENDSLSNTNISATPKKYLHSMRYQYSYNEQGLKSNEIIHFELEDKKLDMSYSYYPSGKYQQITGRYFENKTVTNPKVGVVSHNNKGWETKEDHDGNKTISFKYTTDSIGNWTKMETYNNTVLESVTTRAITYYTTN